MDTTLEATLIIITAIFVLFTSMLDPKLAAGIATAAVFVYIVYKVTAPKKKITLTKPIMKAVAKTAIKKTTKKAKKTTKKGRK